MTATKRVLVIDDSSTTIRQLSRIVEALDGYEVVATGRNGAEALKLYREHRPDIICMDIVMPVMDGLQAARAITSHDSEVRVVMVSSLGQVGDKANDAFKLGAAEIISKPFDQAQVHDVLRKL